jgi:hypothetical protein
MILRIDKLAIDLPKPKNPSPNSAAALQELLGGKFGEMSTSCGAPKISVQSAKFGTATPRGWLGTTSRGEHSRWLHATELARGATVDRAGR